MCDMNKEKQVKLKKESNLNQLIIKVRKLEEQNRILRQKISKNEAN